jgi:hypothetical protein
MQALQYGGTRNDDSPQASHSNQSGSIVDVISQKSGEPQGLCIF